jgi:NADPH2:quinone reductase
MNANVVLRFVLLYGVPADALERAAADITAALTSGALTELPAHKFRLDDIVAAQDAVQNGVVGKVLVVPA